MVSMENSVNCHVVQAVRTDDVTKHQVHVHVLVDGRGLDVINVSLVVLDAMRMDVPHV